VSNLADEALWISREGFPVFPVERHSKKPLVRWQPYQQRLQTEQEVKNWWERWPEANIGMATGSLSRLVVLDCDSPDALEIFITSFPEARDTAQAQTGRGRHFYFAWEPGIRTASAILGPGIDLRGEGGFIILPPSVHSNGKIYEWLNDSDPLPLPPPLKQTLTGYFKHEPGFKSGETPSDRIRVGQRNTVLTSLAGSMRQRGMTEQAIEAALHAENRLSCDPPLPEIEVKTIARSVAHYQPSFPSPIGPNVMDGTGIVWAKDVPPPSEGDKIESLWGPFLYPQSLHLLSGDAGLAKTTLGYSLSVSLVRGESFAGFSPPRPLRILYFDLETPELLFREKLYRISENNPPEGLAFARDFNVEGALALVKAHKFDLMIVDTGNEAFDTREEEDNAEANKQMRQLRRLIQETGVAILVFYHMGKNPSAKGVYKLRGASARPAAADIVLNLEEDGYVRDGLKFFEVIKLEVVKSRWAEKGKLSLKKVGDDRFEVTEPRNEQGANQEREAESFILGLLPQEPEVTETKEILKLGSTRGYTQPTIERALTNLAKSSQILRPKRGNYCRPRTHPSHQGYRDDGLRDEGNGEAEAQRPNSVEWPETDLWPTTWI